MTPAFLDRRFVVVTGKGGVGRTSIAAALGVHAARSGKRVAVVEMSGAAEVAEVFGLAGRSYQPRVAARGVTTFSLTPRECLDDFGTRKLRLGMVARRIVNNRVTRAFFEAVPGLHDLQQLGKIENLINEPLPDDPHYDLVVLDAPATGHGLTLLAAARSMREMTRVGPFADLARIIERFLANREQTAIVLATLPEALPVHESIELIEALREDGAELSAILVNQLRPPPLPSSPPWNGVRDALVGAGAPWSDVATLANHALDRQASQRAALAELRAGVQGPPILELPRVAGTSPRDRVLALADALGAR